MVQTTDIEGALRHLQIKYRRTIFPDSVLYFCDDPEHTTFNLECGDDGGIRIWRFLLVDIPSGHTGEKIEEAGRDSVTGLEITDDNILNFYIRKTGTSISHSCMSELLQELISDFLRKSGSIQNHFRYLTYA